MRIRDFLGNALYKFTFYLLTYYLFSAPEIFIPGVWCDTTNRRRKPAPENWVDLWRRFLERVTWTLLLTESKLPRFCTYFFLHNYLLLPALTALNGLSRADVTRSPLRYFWFPDVYRNALYRPTSSSNPCIIRLAVQGRNVTTWRKDLAGVNIIILLIIIYLPKVTVTTSNSERR